MSVDQPLVSIISIDYNQPEVTREMLDSVRRMSYPNLEVIVVDNASRENLQDEFNRDYPEVIYIRSEENLGFSGGNNLGINASHGEYLFFVNNDTELIDGCIETLITAFQQNTQLGAISPLIYHHPDFHQTQGELIQYAGTTPVSPYTARNKTIGSGEVDQNQFREARETPYTHGAAMMIPRHVIAKVGMMPEVFFLYYEELDWCEKIRKAGYQIYIDPRAKIYHKESVSVGKMSTLKTYYLNRNRVLFIRRNYPAGQQWLFALFLIFITFPKNVILYALKGQWDHARAFIRAIFWHRTAESRQAIKALPQLSHKTASPKTEV